ncbi:MAG: type ISP restriction/modification enzyme [Bacteroidales bacterium]|nr:type ISP restriction/modification enzyme [Bacteroidales bacterium]
MLKEYLNLLQKAINQGDAREESYYTHLDWLIRNFADDNNIKTVEITILPKKTEAGNPDFRVWDGSNHITGYIEAKDPSVTNLDWIAESDQLKRYRNTFPNVILTNFYEFRLYRDGELIKKTSIGRSSIARKLKTAPPVENEIGFNDLLNTFFSFSLPQVRNSKSLALELAKRTRFLRDEVVSIELAEEGRSGKKAILGFYEAFKKYLIGTLTEQSFADLYSQTITYGLFAARTRSDNSFNRELAFRHIPHTIGILRDVFRFISLEDPPKPLQIIVDDIAEVLSVADVNKILQDYYREGKGQDPILHFYETFLTAYDPTIRDKRGVYYTPEPVVGYIVRSINQILKTHFDLSDGLASEEVTLLDPAGGTLTFPAEAIKVAVKEYTDKYGTGGKTKLIKNHILQNFYAFELMMAPYAIGHLKMSFLLEELGYSIGDDERFKLYLTNTLEMEDLEQIQIPGLSSLSEESHLAGKVKKEQPVLVILGNPPYSGISSNINTWTEKLLKQCVDGATSYYEVDGNPLGEKKLWLQDDYVKFLRFAQWKIHKAGSGVVGMITNHSYLDNPTFRGMRQSLMNTFNEIYILDLHGNSLKKETCPDGSKDENVFDIRQGTAIALFVKQKNRKGCKVYHADQYGLREVKYDWLNSNDFKQENYDNISPESPWYFFIPRDTDKIKSYLEWKAINKIFPVNVTGIVTARDGLAIDFTENSLRTKIMMFRNKNVDDHTIEQAYNVNDNYQWKIAEQREAFRKVADWENYFKEILYRPFDIRHIYYQENIVFRTRKEVMRHMLEKEKNLSICFMRQFSGDMDYTHFLVSNYIVDNRTFFSSKGIIQQAPLYLYKEKISQKSRFQSMMLFEPEAEYKAKTPNINTALYEKLNNAYQKQLTPEEILYYIYAVFYSNIYRQKYAEFLKIDFPRVPFTANYQTFIQMAAFGEELVNLHLLKDSAIHSLVSKYQGEGSNNKVEKVVYNEHEQRVYINQGKYFENISPEVWNYRIGGYQVLKKYLDDRKKAGKDIGDETHYSKIVTAISKTIQLQAMIDHIYPELEKELLEF